MSNKIRDENMPQGRRGIGQANRAGKKAKRKRAYQIVYISAPCYFLTANILHNCSAELSFLCFLSYNIKAETSLVDSHPQELHFLWYEIPLCKLLCNPVVV